MKQIARSEFGGGLSEISLNKLIIKLIKRNIRIPGESLNEGTHNESLSFLRFVNRVFWSGHGIVL